MSLRSRLGWYAARASAMSGREILHRAGGTLTLARDRIARAPVPAHEGGRSGGARHPAAPQLVTDAALEAARALPGAVTAAADRAEPAADGRVAFFGHPEARVGTRPDWHRDPGTGHRWPLTHWSRIDHREADADPKWIWELGRHQHLTHLARAWRLTGEARFARAACDGLDSFVAQNPPGQGVHWRVGLELGLRLVSWSWTLAFLEGFEGLDADLHSRVIESAAAHLAHLERYPSLHSSANNHRIGELMGLVVGGICFPEVENAAGFVARGLPDLERELALQTHPDGVNAEQAIGYQSFVLDMIIAVMAVMARADRPIPPGLSEPAAGMARFLACMASDRGTLPRIGDQDDALGIDLASDLDDAERLWSRLRTVERLLDIELERREPGVDEQTIWLTGGPIESSERVRPGSAVFPQGGYAILRDRSEGELRAVLKAGPFGLGPLYAHAHADQLALCLAVDGREVVVDCGTFTYYDQRGWRDYGRSTAAHSTLRVDGREQAEPAGRFMWSTTAAGHLGPVEERDETLEVSAWHDAYGPVRHLRRVVLRGRTIEIADLLTGPRVRHDIELRWHLAPGEMSGEGSAWRWSGGEAPLALTIDGLDYCRVAENETNPPVGLISPGLERSEPAPALIGTVSGLLPIRITTVLEAL